MFVKLFASVNFLCWFAVSRAAIRIPDNPCPDLFKYKYDNVRYLQYGEIVIPYYGEKVLDLNVNVSLAIYDRRAKLRLELLTVPETIQESRAVKYKVIFPNQQVLPKLTQIVFNGRLYCSGPPEPLVPGEPGITNLWARSTLRLSTFMIPPDTPCARNGTSTISDISKNGNRNPDFETSTTPDVVECGVANNLQTLVVNGVETHPNQYPWLVAMFAYDKSSYFYKCTGNLISDRHVITAAHCVNYFKLQLVNTEDILFVLGKSNISRWNDAETRTAKSVVVHPDYRHGSGHADMAIITLNRPVMLKKNLRPICLWDGDTQLEEVTEKTGVVAGWGKDESGKALNIPLVKQVDLPIVSQVTCLRSNQAYVNLTSEKTFCAGNRDLAGPCTGDSGAGFMMETGGKYKLRGLVSVSLSYKKSCDLNNYIVFCDVAKFGDWIKSAMADG